MMNDLDIPPPPNALIIAMHRHTQRCMGIVTVAFDAKGHLVPMWAKDQIADYQMWNGEDFVVCARSLCDLRWHIL
jgi:hypothetical protein